MFGCLIVWLPVGSIEWLFGFLVVGYLVVWLPGCLVSWLFGFLVVWFPGYMNGWV